MNVIKLNFHTVLSDTTRLVATRSLSSCLQCDQKMIFEIDFKCHIRVQQFTNFGQFNVPTFFSGTTVLCVYTPRLVATRSLSSCLQCGQNMTLKIDFKCHIRVQHSPILGNFNVPTFLSGTTKLLGYT